MSLASRVTELFSRPTQPEKKEVEKKEEPVQPPAKPISWQAGRAMLREALHEANVENKEMRFGDDKLIHRILPTFICACLAHMHGHIHMSWFRKYGRGWREPFNAPKKTPVDLPEMKAAYGEYAQRYYECAVIASLDDQMNWIAWACEQDIKEYGRYGRTTTYRIPKELRDLAKHVIANDWCV